MAAAPPPPPPPVVPPVPAAPAVPPPPGPPPPRPPAYLDFVDRARELHEFEQDFFGPRALPPVAWNLALDNVVLAFPPLAPSRAIAVLVVAPHPPVMCARNVVLLAKALCDQSDHPDRPIVQDIWNHFPHFGMANEGIDPATMQRLLSHHLKNFPIYLYTGGDYPNCGWARLYGRPRDDAYGIVYIPGHHLGPGAAAHWAFLRVYEGDAVPYELPEVAGLYEDRPILFFGVLPLVATPRQRGRLFWRCSFSFAHGMSIMPELERARREGWACSHCLELPCPCEVAFMERHPDAVRICCLGTPNFMENIAPIEVQEVFPHPLDPADLAQHEVAGAPAPDAWRCPRPRVDPVLGHVGLDYTLIPAPSNALVIGHRRSGRSTTLIGHRAVVSLNRLIEHLFHAFLPSAIAVRLRTATTFSETFFPFYHWGQELPVRRQRLRLAQFGVEAALYADRGFAGYVKSVAHSLCWTLLLCYVSARSAPYTERVLSWLVQRGCSAMMLAGMKIALVYSLDFYLKAPDVLFSPWSLFRWLPKRYRPVEGIFPAFVRRLTTFEDIDPTALSDHLGNFSTQPSAEFASAHAALAARVPTAAQLEFGGDLPKPVVFFGETWAAWRSRLWGVVKRRVARKQPQLFDDAVTQAQTAAAWLIPLLPSGACVVNGPRLVRSYTFVSRVMRQVRRVANWIPSLAWLSCNATAVAGALDICVATYRYARYRRTPRFVFPNFAPILQEHVADLQVGGHLNIPDLTEISTRLAMRAEVDEATARHVISNHMRRHDAFGNYVARPAMEAYVQRLLTTPARTPPGPPALPPNTHCWSCSRRDKTLRHLCRQCRGLAKLPAYWRPLISRTYRFHAEPAIFRPIFSAVVSHPHPAYKAAHYHIDDHTGQLFVHRMRNPREAPHLSWRQRGERVYAAQEFDQAVNFWDHFHTTERIVSARGLSCGPIIQGYEPSCFVRGDSTAAAAYLIRNLAERPHWHDAPDRAALGFWNFAYLFLDALEYVTRIERPGADAVGIIELQPSDTAAWLAQLDDSRKRAEAEQALAEIARGDWPEIKRIKASVYPVDSTPDRACKITVPSLLFKGFTKAEKTCMVEWTRDCSLWVDKRPMKPRFICVPGTLALVVLGRYTHRQTKWLTEVFPVTSPLFYAGCSEPAELRGWLNTSLARYPNPMCVIDDISAMDANHCPDSFRFHNRVRARQFPFLPPDVDELYRAIEHVTVKIGQYSGAVSHINPSGVPDTSYKNSLMAVLIRWMAFAHASFDLFVVDRVARDGADDLLVNFRLRPGLNTAAAISLMRAALSHFVMAASGDDGLIYTTHEVATRPVGSPSWLAAYTMVWNASGFNIKVDVSTNFRLATFLANRPVYSSAGFYEWAPEPARRLKSLFWMFDKNHHPVAWARGVASQVVTMARHAPVLSDICVWYLRRTTGPIVKEPAEFHRYNPMWSNKAIGHACERTLEEFCHDYKIPLPEYQAFLAWLDSLPHPFLSLNCFVLERILDAES